MAAMCHTVSSFRMKLTVQNAASLKGAAAAPQQQQPTRGNPLWNPPSTLVRVSVKLQRLKRQHKKLVRSISFIT
jgi:hypothetical protein